MNNLPVGILLAAGQSNRFGSNKLLHPVIDNTAMLLVTARKLVSVLPGSIAVINQGLTSYIKQLEQVGMHVVINQQANRGMGSSIACGIRASQGAAGWLITLADMPYIKTETIMQLVKRMKEGAEIIAPALEQRRGHPVGFNRYFKNELLGLNDDVGARHIISKYQSKLELMPTNDSGIFKDIDQPDEVLSNG